MGEVVLIILKSATKSQVPEAHGYLRLDPGKS
jgi:hypothetical protein